MLKNTLPTTAIHGKRKKFILAVSFVVIFILLEHTVGFMLSFEPYNSNMRVIMHEYYQGKESIDTVFLGTSHTQQTFDPNIIDENSKRNSYNLGSPSQGVIDSYYLCKEVLKNESINTIVLELSYTSFNNYDWTSNPVNFYIVYDNMTPSMNKIEYFMDRTNSDIWGETLFKASRYKTNFNSTYFADNYFEKLHDSIDYRYYEYNPNVQYYGKGFVTVTFAFNKGNVGIPSPYLWSNNNINEESVKYYEKIVELCNSNNIEIILVTAPVPIPSIIYMNNYGDAHNYIQELATKFNLTYYDFNLVKPNVFYREDGYFYDSSHLNYDGAEKFSEVFSEFLKNYSDGNIDMNHYFYNTFDEMWAEIDYVAAVGLEYNKSGYIAKSLAGKYVIPEYEFLFKAQGESKFVVLQEYSENSRLNIRENTIPGSIMRVNSRAKGSEAEYEEYWEIIND